MTGGGRDRDVDPLAQRWPPRRLRLAAKLRAVNFVAENARIFLIYAVANPQKLRRLDEPKEIGR
jgi:hypothetical protein